MLSTFLLIHMLSFKLIPDHAACNSYTWRSKLSKVDIWYAAFGSNLWLKRLLCYIEGGQVHDSNIFFSNIDTLNL